MVVENILACHPFIVHILHLPGTSPERGAERVRIVSLRRFGLSSNLRYDLFVSFGCQNHQEGFVGLWQKVMSSRKPERIHILIFCSQPPNKHVIIIWFKAKK